MEDLEDNRRVKLKPKPSSKPFSGKLKEDIDYVKRQFQRQQRGMENKPVPESGVFNPVQNDPLYAENDIPKGTNLKIKEQAGTAPIDIKGTDYEHERFYFRVWDSNYFNPDPSIGATFKNKPDDRIDEPYAKGSSLQYFDQRYSNTQFQSYSGADDVNWRLADRFNPLRETTSIRQPI